MSFFYKPLSEISFTDIEFLVQNKIRESYDLDYKLDYPQNKNLAKLMISFANATGGYIVIGIEEEKIANKNTGIPKELKGVQKGDHSTKITQIALGHTQPKIFPKIKIIDYEEQPQKVIVIISIDEAPEPIMYFHMNDSDSNKFFIRINDKNEPADQVLLKKLFSRRPFFEELKQLESKITKEQKLIFDDYFGPDVGGEYIFFGFSLFPYNNNFDIINTNDKDVEFFLKDLYTKLSHRSPSREIKDFYHLIRNLSYNGDSYSSYYRYTGEKYHEAEFDIFSNGNINTYIIFKPRNATNLISESHKEYDESRKAEYAHSPFFYHDIFPYLIIMFLRLAKSIFKNKVEGRFKIMTRIMATHNISLDVYEFLQLSSSTDFSIKRTLYFNELMDIEKFKIFVCEILKEFLRYFNYNLKEVDRYLEIFHAAVDRYIS